MYRQQGGDYLKSIFVLRKKYMISINNNQAELNLIHIMHVNRWQFCAVSALTSDGAILTGHKVSTEFAALTVLKNVQLCGNFRPSPSRAIRSYNQIEIAE
ncbi:hypothetical protein HNR39_000596 [Glaciimonas immobilis]|uniref:Uncharacterized protein n=1 Tax=Glaciimonas immobilis TaxID=728004 RepID=A0A840RP58_9BURK|nr:hypothetical protein [Glaciimonas immobilis]